MTLTNQLNSTQHFNSTHFKPIQTDSNQLNTIPTAAGAVFAAVDTILDETTRYFDLDLLIVSLLIR